MSWPLHLATRLLARSLAAERRNERKERKGPRLGAGGAAIESKPENGHLQLRLAERQDWQTPLVVQYRTFSTPGGGGGGEIELARPI